MGPKYSLILASSSPRRQFLMRELGYSFTVQTPGGDESFSPDMEVNDVPLYLARKKAASFKTKIETQVVMTADTVVILHNTILNKPIDREDAVRMLSELSGKTHLVITAVCLSCQEKTVSFDDYTEVTFNKLKLSAIESYIDDFKPFDKAGSYGAQECLPLGANPCSLEETEFLKGIDKLDLIQKSLISGASVPALLAIDKIRGSYFNVMGLPIHKVHNQLKQFGI